MWPSPVMHARGRLTSRPPTFAFRRMTAVLLLATLATSTGCYTYVPVTTASEIQGEYVSLAITDEGRVGLGERLGPGVTKIEGRLSGRSNDTLAVQVYRVNYIGGESNRWSGEPIRLRSNYVSQVQGRRLSRSKSWLAAGIAAVAVGLFIVTRGLGGFGGSGGDDPPDGPPQGS